MPLARPIVNAMGTMTSLGGSRMSPTVIQAMAHASRSFVDINGLFAAAGEKVAQLCKAPDDFSAQICTGAAASLALAAAACMTLNEPDESSLLLLPDRADQLHRRLILVDGGSDTRWEQAIKSVGCIVHRLGAAGSPMTADDLASAPWDRAAAFFYFAGGLPAEGTPGCSALKFSFLVSLCQDKSIPLVVDAAAQLPPRSNLWRWTSAGADVCVFSGGKSIGGPQGTGILLARKDIIARVRRLASPNEDTVGRPLKVAKECVAGLVAALEDFVGGCVCRLRLDRRRCRCCCCSLSFF
jgi:L-seryl-tRNA(Ser) seleniumtransferase